MYIDELTTEQQSQLNRLIDSDCQLEVIQEDDDGAIDTLIRVTFSDNSIGCLTWHWNDHDWHWAGDTNSCPGDIGARDTL